MNNTLIMSSPRSGTNFLGRVLTEKSNVFNAGEFFGCVNRVQRRKLFCCGRHLEYLSWYVSIGYRVNYAMEVYQKLLDHLRINPTRISKETNCFNPEQLGLLIDFINLEMNNEYSPSHLIEIAKDKNRLLLKVFYNQYSLWNKFDIYKVVEMVDNVILLHRENVLNRYISHHKAIKNDIWIRFPSTKECVETKIEWNLKQYLSFYGETLRDTNNHLNIIENTDKKTAIIKYEDFDSHTNPYKYIKHILETREIDCNVAEGGHRIPVKQRNESLDIANNFINKDEFMDDYAKIKHKIAVKIEEL